MLELGLEAEVVTGIGGSWVPLLNTAGTSLSAPPWENPGMFAQMMMMVRMMIINESNLNVYKE